MNFYNQPMALRGSNFKQVANIENLLPNSWSPAVAHRLDLVNIFIDQDNANNYRYNSTASNEFNERTYFNIEHYNNITIAENSGNISDINSFPLGNNSNLTLLDAPTFTSASLTKIIFFGTMFVISLIGNVATVIQMRRLRRRKSTINTLIVNLAVADLLVTFFCTAGEAAWAVTVQWLAGDAMCKLVKYMQVFSLYLSTYITVAISLDRCVAILDPMRRNGASQRVRIMILFAWIFSALFSIPQLTLFNVLRGPFKEEFYQCVDFGPYRSAWQLKLYPVASLMFAFVLPLAVIGTAYGLIFTTISRKSKEHSVMDSFQMPSSKSWVTRMVSYKSYLCVALCNQSISSQESISSSCSRGPVRSHLLRKAKRKSLRMSFVIVLAFIVCWAPYYIFFFYVTFLGKVIDPMIFTCFSFIGLSNTMLNPIIYGAFQLCKVHFYNPSSWRRNAWRGTSPRLQSTNLHREHPFDYQAATPASSCCSVDSNKRLLAKPCHCEMCHYQVKDQMVHLHLQKKTCKHFDSGRCWNCTQKFTNRKLKDCLCLHSYLN